jgi:SAM-dependent methyltransferase
MDSANDSVWTGDYKIPWNDPDFSKRMLAEHLTQSHDMASRRLEWVERQVEWIHRAFLNGRRSDILDLGCGPGFYSHRLAARGHRCRGIDFGPASIEYAQQQNPDRSRCEFVLADIRQAAFGGPCDLAMILYGEMNVFAPAEVLSILGKIKECLAPRQGRLILEIQKPEAVERGGCSEPSEQQFGSGLFSDRPHRCRTVSRWLPRQQVAIQTFMITEPTGGPAQVYRSTTKAWNAADLTALLEIAGFCRVSQHPDWPSNTDSLALWSAETR